MVIYYFLMGNLFRRLLVRLARIDKVLRIETALVGELLIYYAVVE
jgi:hypothetical protein